MLKQAKNKITDPEQFIEYAGAYVSYVSNDSAFACGRYADKYMRLLFINSGKAAVNVDGNVYPMSSDSVICLKKGQKVHISKASDEPMTASIVAFTRSRMPILTDEFIDVIYEDSKPLHIPSLYLEQMKRCVHGFMCETANQPPYFELLMQNGVQVLLVDIYRMRTDYLTEDDSLTSEERVSAFLELINRTYYDSYDLVKAAKTTFLCPRQFSNICKKITGLSFINYVNKVRVEKAKELIRDTHMSITQIALMVGFENLSSFYRAFKKIYNTPPLNFREVQ